MKPEGAKVCRLFAGIAERYDLANRTLSFGSDTRWRRRLAREVGERKPERVLDLACGSGDVAFTLAGSLPPPCPILALDFCEPMLEQARHKQQRLDPDKRIHFGHSDILELAEEDASHDAVTIAFGLRNLEDRQRGLREMHRVLRPGGHLFCLEFTQPYGWFRPFYYLYLKYILPRLAGWLTGKPDAYHYLAGTIEAFPTAVDLSEQFRSAGFRGVHAIRMTFGIVALHIARKDETPAAATAS